MPVDTSIYGQQRQFAIADPMESAMKATQLRAANRQFQMDDAINAAGRESGGDPERMAEALMRSGQYQPAMQMRSAAEAQKAKRMEGELKKMEAISSDGIALDAAYRQALQANGGNHAMAQQAIQPAYDQVRSRWAAQGVQLGEVFDPVKNLAGVGQAKEMAQYLKSINPTYGAPVAATLPDGTQGMVQPSNLGGAPAVMPGVAPKAPEQPTAVREYEYAKGQGYAGTFEQFQQQQRKAGATSVTIQPPGPMTPGKTAAGKIDEDMLGVTKNLMQLDTIAGQFKPEYQRFQDRVGYQALRVKDSTTGLTNKEKQDLTDFSQYRRNAFNTLNDYIKSVTGAAMSEAEAKRIMKAMPNAGEGMFDGDSPTEFKAKLDDAIGQTKKAVARLAYLKRNGMSLEDGLGKGITLDRMPAMMNERGQAIEAELKAAQPNADAKALQRAVRRQLAVEFGLSSD